MIVSPRRGRKRTGGSRMQRGEVFDETFTVQGPGTFIFDVSDWSNGCNLNVGIFVDGEQWFGINSYALNPDVDRSLLKNWNKVVWRPEVRQTDDREIAFELK